MGDHELRDRHGRLLGKIKEQYNGKLEGRDAHGRFKGTYDPNTDQTRDEHGRLVGKGNMLSVLIID